MIIKTVKQCCHLIVPYTVENSKKTLANNKNPNGEIQRLTATKFHQNQENIPT